MNALDVLFSKGRAEIFRQLFVQGASEFYLRELTRLTGLNLRTIQRELALLAEAELVLVRRDGNRVYYRANRAHPLFPELCGMVLKSDRAAEVLQSALRELPGIDVAFLFGSVARRSEKAGSDIDLFLIGEAGLRSVVPALNEAGRILNREINPYNISADSWRKKLAANDIFLQNVANGEKVFVKGSPDDLERLAE